MAKGHKDKVAVITGAAAGLGRAFAKRLAEDGVHIVLVDIERPDETEALIKAAGREVLSVKCDISSSGEVASMAGEVERRFHRCDILVNNAGIYPVKAFEDISFADWRRVLSINLDGMFLLAKAFTPGMRQRGWGRIVNLASNTFGLVIPGFVHYIASKGGVIGFTRALASELASYGITVNAIAPSLTRTPGTAARGKEFEAEAIVVANMQAIKRVEEPGDLVGAMSFLTSDDAAFITGQTLYVDGGLVRV